MEYCGGGSVADICEILEHPLTEEQIRYVCKESLKVSMLWDTEYISINMTI